MGRKRWFTDTEKRCAKCKKWLPYENFGTNKASVSGYSFRCLDCQNEYARTWSTTSRRRDARIGLLLAARQRAREMHLPFNLTLTDIYVPLICPVLGIPIKTGSLKPVSGSPSLDRIIPKLGYIRGNIIVISFKANTIRSNASLEEIQRVAAYAERILHATNQ